MLLPQLEREEAVCGKGHGLATGHGWVEILALPLPVL